MRFCPACHEIYPDDSSFCPLDGTQLEVPSDPWIGKTLDNRYQITRKIGEGGMGRVYRAVQLHPERQVAIKILPKDSLRKPTMRERFNREGIAAAMIQHEHIVQVYDSGETDDRIPYLVMELLEGTSLTDRIQKGPIGTKQAVSILMQVCEALGPVHALGIVHRDLKPDNIFLTHSGESTDYVKILDFGIALLQDKPRLTDKNLIIGTPEYIAPEQVLAKTIGPYTDLYSLGGIAYEMMSGRPPFGDASHTELLVKHVKENPCSLDSLNPRVPSALSAIIMRLLEKDPSRRYADAYALLHDLRSLGLVSEVAPRPDAATVEQKRAPEPVSSAPSATHEKWQKFLSTTKDRSHEIKDAMDLIREMETLTERLASISKEQQSLSQDIEKIERSENDTKARLRHALESLAQELSKRRAHYLDVSGKLAELDARSLAEEKIIKKQLEKMPTFTAERLAYGDVEKCALLADSSMRWMELFNSMQNLEPQKDRGENEVNDLEYQIHQLRKRIESVGLESVENKKSALARLDSMEREKQEIKERLGKISVLFSKGIT